MKLRYRALAVMAAASIVILPAFTLGTPQAQAENLNRPPEIRRCYALDTVNAPETWRKYTDGSLVVDCYASDLDYTYTEEHLRVDDIARQEFQVNGEPVSVWEAGADNSGWDMPQTLDLTGYPDESWITVAFVVTDKEGHSAKVERKMFLDYSPTQIVSYGPTGTNVSRTAVPRIVYDDPVQPYYNLYRRYRDADGYWQWKPVPIVEHSVGAEADPDTYVSSFTIKPTTYPLRAHTTYRVQVKGFGTTSNNISKSWKFTTK